MIPEFTVGGASAPNGPEHEAVRGWLRAFNRQASPEFFQKIELGENHPVPLELFAFRGGAVIGGVLGETQLAWLKIAILAVDPEHRLKGVGKALLDEAERIGAGRGCKYAVLDTMSYQAPDFYVRNGYVIAGRIPDWDSHGHAKFYLTKTIV